MVLQIEPRFFLIFLLIFPLYTLAAFVGNDWAYMLPCTLFASLVIGFVLPLIEIASISCSCRIPAKSAISSEQEVILKAWRLPFFGILSNLIPSGYLNAQLFMMRRNWSGARRTPSVVPLPVVLQSLGHGIEMHLRLPSLTRGVYEAEALEISTCFPFAMVWWSRRINLATDTGESCVTVLPVLKEVMGNFHSRLTSTSINTGRTMRSWMSPHKSTSLKGLREFTERDSLNQIHWASSARSGKLMMREFEVESLPDYDVLLNLEHKWNSHEFELACSAAYALIHYGYRLGFQPQLRLHPPLDWSVISEQLEDIPAGLAGEELSAEILARLSPLPAELASKYERFEKDNQKVAIDAMSDLALSTRTVVSIIPSKRDRGPGAVALVEIPRDTTPHEYSSPAVAHQVLAQVESETELGRI